MYNEFFGFTEEPFRLTPDPSFFFMTKGHGEALSSLTSGIKERKGIITITGDVGTGKTTLIYALLKDMNHSTKTSFIFNPRLTFKQLLKAILWDLKVPGAGNSTCNLLQKFDLYVRERSARDETVLIVIDEAQNLSSGVLEHLGRFCQRETPAAKFQTLLVGQLELEANLNAEELRDFKNRIALHRRLSPLNWEESKAYIDHRLKIVGSGISRVFTPEAVDRICGFAKGIPRVINTICDRALLAGYRLSIPKIDAMIAKRVISEEEDTGLEIILEERKSTGEEERWGSMDDHSREETDGSWEQGLPDAWGESMKKKTSMAMVLDGKGIGPGAGLEPKDTSCGWYSGSFLGRYKYLKEKNIALELKKNLLQKECIELAARIAEKETELKAIEESLSMEADKRRRAEEILGCMEERVRYLSSEFLDLQEKDKQFIAGDLLSVITSLILSLKSGVEDILHIMKGESDAALFNFEPILYNLQNGIQKAEEILVRLYPPTLDDSGILSTMGWYCQKFQKYHTQFQIAQEIDVQEDEISDPLKKQLFRILQEALDVITEHGRGDRVCVSVTKKDGKLHLTVEENGSGSDLHEFSSEAKANGLTRLKHRTALSGGSFSVESGEVWGTVIRASWPI